MLNKLLNDIFTERNNNSFCPVRVCGITGFYAYLILAYIELFRHTADFNLFTVASGISTILGILAGGVSLKSRTENQ